MSFTIRLSEHRDGVFQCRRFPFQIVKRVPIQLGIKAWLFEVKHDGFRVLAIRDDGPRACTRETAMTSAVVISTSSRHLAAFPAERFVLDGELVVLEDTGRFNFTKLARARTGTHYFASTC